MPTRRAARPSAPSTKRTKRSTVPTTVKRTRGGHQPTGTSANRRARAANGTTPKGERARAELIRAARTVFERMGYIDARVSDVVKEARMAHGSFYTYFESKLEVFQAVLTDMSKDFDEAVAHGAEDVPGDTVMNLERANRRYLETYRQHAKMMMLYDQVATIDPEIAKRRIEGRRRHVARVAGTIERLQRRKMADSSVDAAPTAAALVAMLASYAYWSNVPPLDLDVATTAHIVTSIWARSIGLKAPKRR